MCAVGVVDLEPPAAKALGTGVGVGVYFARVGFRKGRAPVTWLGCSWRLGWSCRGSRLRNWEDRDMGLLLAKLSEERLDCSSWTFLGFCFELSGSR